MDKPLAEKFEIVKAALERIVKEHKENPNLTMEQVQAIADKAMKDVGEKC